MLRAVFCAGGAGAACGTSAFSRYSTRVVISYFERARLGIRTALNFSNRETAIGSFCASIASGSWRERVTHALSRREVRPARSGPTESPLPTVWQAAQRVWNMYLPWSGALKFAEPSAYPIPGLSVLLRLRKFTICVARKRGLSIAELRIQLPESTSPIISDGWWPSLFLTSVMELRPNFLATSLMSFSSPVTKVQPGGVWNLAAYALSTSGVSCSGSMLTETKKISLPKRSPRIFATCESLAVSSGQVAVHLV